MDNSLLMYYIHLGYLADIDFGIFILQFISMSDHLVMNFADIRHLTKKHLMTFAIQSLTFLTTFPCNLV